MVQAADICAESHGEFSCQMAAVTARRQQLPWVDVTDANYVFDDMAGKATPIAELFGTHDQVLSTPHSLSGINAPRVDCYVHNP